MFKKQKIFRKTFVLFVLCAYICSMAKKEVKSKRIGFRFTETTRKTLVEVSKKSKRTMSDYVALLIDYAKTNNVIL